MGHVAKTFPSLSLFLLLIQEVRFVVFAAPGKRSVFQFKFDFVELGGAGVALANFADIAVDRFGAALQIQFAVVFGDALGQFFQRDQEFLLGFADDGVLFLFAFLAAAEQDMIDFRGCADDMMLNGRIFFVLRTAAI